MPSKPAILLPAFFVPALFLLAPAPSSQGASEEKSGAGIGTPKQVRALQEAFARRDSDAIAQLGWRMGTSGLLAILRDDTKGRELRIAALRAAPHAPDAFALLGSLANIASRPDRSVALEASAAALQISGDIDESQLADNEVTRAQIQGTANQWLSLASQPGRWTDLRVAAIEIGSIFDRLAPSARAEAKFLALQKDDSSEIRQATVLLARHAMLTQNLVSILEDDLDDWVALAAGQVLCGPLGVASPHEVTKLSPEAYVRMGHLALSRELPIVPRTDLAPCLAGENAKAIALLTKLAPAERKAHLQALRPGRSKSK